MNFSALVLAAYSVAKSAGDSQYLANICKDVAQSMMTSAGQSACAAQEEVLQCCDHLYMSRNITDNQLLYLRHLVLIREEEVAEVYDEFQKHGSLAQLLQDLYRIANASAKNTDDKEALESVDTDAEGSPHFETTLSGVLSLMQRAKVVTSSEAMILNHMIKTKSKYLLAAHEVFVNDGNLDELEDTMVRCAKLVSQRIKEENQNSHENESDESSESENDSEGESEDESEEPPHSQLDEVLESMNVKNTWSTTVPSRFILAVFAAAQKDLLGVGQARALCDLFQAKYDLVRAAWEVYNVQGDVVDFTDTLRRIVRDLNFREDGNVHLSNSNEDPNDVIKAMKESKDRTDAAFHNKQEALFAVAEAKQELLRHSLEMMVKQGIVSPDAAQTLYKRAAQGDALTDAAIEAYASDRNIMEFLDTLQILANNSPEELDRLMRSADDEEDDDDEDSENQEDSATATSDEGTDEYDDSDFEDEDEDEESESGSQVPDLSQKKLFEVILELVENDIINAGTATILMKLVESKDNRVMAAYDVFEEYNDKDDLLDSLLRVARLELQKHLASSNAQEEDGIEMSSIKKESAADSDDEKVVEVEMTRMKKDGVNDEACNGDITDAALNSSDQISIIDILSKAGAIEPAQAERVIQLIRENDSDVRRIFLSYEQNKDVYHLIDSLRSHRANTSEEKEEFDDSDDDSEDDSNDTESIETRFLTIIQGMNLSHLETSALRLAIARDDFAIRSALEMFRVSRDEAQLISTLREVAKKTIDTTLTEAGYDGIDKGEEKDGSDDISNNQEDLNSDNDSQDSGDGDRDGSHSDDRRAEASGDVDNDDDLDDTEEGGLMATQATREYIFPILLAELVKEKVLTEEDGSLLEKLFSVGDDVVNAALDVYDLDSDMAELVDTLQKIASCQSKDTSE